MSKFFKRFYLGIVLVFLYVPILVLIIQSFNGGKSRAKCAGMRSCFTTRPSWARCR